MVQQENEGHAVCLPSALSAGFLAPFFTNIGNVSSKGVDVLIGYRDKAGELGYDISVNAGSNKNNVTNLDGIATKRYL